MTAASDDADRTVAAGQVRKLAEALLKVCDGARIGDDEGEVQVGTIDFALAQFGIYLPVTSRPEPAPAITFPAPAVTSDDEAAAARAAWARHFDQPAAPQSVVIGWYGDGSGASDWAYGPFTPDEAARWAAMLTDGEWHRMQWSAVRLVGWPEGGQD